MYVWTLNIVASEIPDKKVGVIFTNYLENSDHFNLQFRKPKLSKTGNHDQ